jgi:hypothetical protein
MPEPTATENIYRLIRSVYQDDSMAASAFFSDAERREILSRLEAAYLTLINPESRTAYDRTLMDMGIMEEGDQYRDKSKGKGTIS